MTTRTQGQKGTGRRACVFADKERVLAEAATGKDHADAGALLFHGAQNVARSISQGLDGGQVTHSEIV